MAVTSANYATCQTALRRCLASGTNPTGEELQLMLDVIQHGSSNERDTAAAALEALLVTHMAIWDAAKGGATAAEYAAALAALATPRTAAIAGAVITDLTASDGVDGRPRP
jgi:hypothetical protein